ncbi:MAG TPA: Spy/CpxP family protein refolding chaperone [Alphaproteobacteria bacterium]|nr:Spy/CpxP family protein refolding chaperone [Alphaproteobacteria bacterium]
MRIATLALFALIAAPAAQADTSPYAGEQNRVIKALSPGEIDDLRMGRGMGLAKAAELNSFPGPAHVLELADRLNLSAEQRARTEALMREMKAEAQRLGAAVLAAEQALDRAFAERRIDDSSLRAKLTEIAALQGELRYVHLRTHLAQTAILTPEQVRRYDVLRGYSQPAAAPAKGHGGHGTHKH